MLAWLGAATSPGEWGMSRGDRGKTFMHLETMRALQGKWTDTSGACQMLRGTLMQFHPSVTAQERAVLETRHLQGGQPEGGP